MKINKISFYSFVLIFILLVFTACSPIQMNGSPDTTADKPGDINETTSEMTQKTQTPVLHGQAYIGNSSYCIAGAAPDGAEIYITGGATPVTALAVDGQFTAEIPVEGSDTNNIVLSVYAQKNDMLRSDALTVVIDDSISVKPERQIMHVGKNNRLFYYDSLPDYIGATLYSEAQLKLIKDNFEGLQAQLAQAGLNTQIIIYIAPNPGTIYPEEMPDNIAVQKVSDNSRLRQLMNYFDENNSTVKFITSIDSLLAAKEKGIETYYKTDTHWNEYGAYYGYCDIFNFIGEHFPAARPYGDDMLDIYEIKVKPGWLIEPVLSKQNNSYIEKVTNVRIKSDLRVGFPIPDDEIMYAYDESFYLLQQYKTNDIAKPDILMYRDSYSIAMLSFISESSNVSTFYSMWDYNIRLDYIIDLAPDYLIIERVERYISDLPYMIR